MAKYLQALIICLTVAGILFLGCGLWIPAKAVLAQYLLRRAWQEALNTGDAIKPWPWADTWPVGRLQVERLAVDLIILEGESGEVLAFGPGHLSRTSPPGSAGNCVLAGHRDTSFAFLRDFRVGDRLQVQGMSANRTYRVQNAQVVRAEDLYLNPETKGILTLITCFPFTAVLPGTPFRYVVTAEEITEEPAAVLFVPGFGESW